MAERLAHFIKDSINIYCFTLNNYKMKSTDNQGTQWFCRSMPHEKIWMGTGVYEYQASRIRL